jgi:hypothetical protein
LQYRISEEGIDSIAGTRDRLFVTHAEKLRRNR